MAIRPSARNRYVRGSGVASTTGVPPFKPLLPVRFPEQPMEMVFICRVTAPVDASARPQSSVAWVFMVMLVFARIFPRNVVLTSMVAELPTSQYKLAPDPVLITSTTELGDVMSVLGIMNTQEAFGLP